jgi:hypothetical protein
LPPAFATRRVRVDALLLSAITLIGASRRGGVQGNLPTRQRQTAFRTNGSTESIAARQQLQFRDDWWPA